LSRVDPIVPDRGFIDVNTVFGPEHGVGGAAGAPLSLLVAERRRHGVRTALASSLVAAAADPFGGNRSAVEAAADPGNGIGAIAVIAPRETDAARRVADAERMGVLGYRLEGWLGGSAAIDGLLRAIADTGRPLLVPIGTGWASSPVLASVVGAQTGPYGIPTVLIGAHYTNSVDTLAALRRYDHLLIETSALAHFRAVATAVATVGADRVLLGTGSPLRAGASAIDAVLLADVPDDAKRAILAGNAARLFGLPSADVALAPPALPERVWDAHAHFGPFDQDVPQVADDELLRALLRPTDGVAVASSAVAIYADPAAGNQAAHAAAAASDRQLAYVVADPRDLAFTEEQLRRHLGGNVVGVKVHANVIGVPTSDPMVRELFSLLARFGRPVKIHNEGNDWARAIDEIARAHPRLPIVIAHAGLGAPSVEAGRLAAAHDNVYLELSSSFARLIDIRRAVAAAPSERLLWGSDVPLLDPGFVFGTYEDAGIPEEAWRRVFWDNAARLYQA